MFTSFSNPQLWSRASGPGDVLNVSEGLHDIIEEAVGSILDFLSLPITESVAQPKRLLAFLILLRCAPLSMNSLKRPSRVQRELTRYQRPPE
jgi:hypothetical protein